MSDDFEKYVSGCKNLKELRCGCSEYKDEVAESLSQPRELLNSILEQLQLNGKNFKDFHNATQREIDAFWDVLLLIDNSLTKEDTTRKSLQNLKSLNEFISHCCTFRKYSLIIKKCGKSDCSTCGRVSMPLEKFSGKHTIFSHCILIFQCMHVLKIIFLY